MWRMCFLLGFFQNCSKIFLITSPPHCKNHIQSLDIAVMGPFKTKYAVVQNNWMVVNPGKKISIHDLTSIIASAYPVSFLMKNISARFQNTGVWPFSRYAVSDENFQVASVVCGGSNEPSVLTAWFVGLTSSSLAALWERK